MIEGAMRINAVSWGIVKRKLLAWLRSFRAEKPIQMPIWDIPVLWTAGNQEAEEKSYTENPLAFWLRPDRSEHDCPVWMITGDWFPSINISPPLYGDQAQNAFFRPGVGVFNSYAQRDPRSALAAAAQQNAAQIAMRQNYNSHLLTLQRQEVLSHRFISKSVLTDLL